MRNKTSLKAISAEMISLSGVNDVMYISFFSLYDTSAGIVSHYMTKCWDDSSLSFKFLPPCSWYLRLWGAFQLMIQTYRSCWIATSSPFANLRLDVLLFCQRWRKWRNDASEPRVWWNDLSIRCKWRVNFSLKTTVSIIFSRGLRLTAWGKTLGMSVTMVGEN